jgi:hypothetical protein
VFALLPRYQYKLQKNRDQFCLFFYHVAPSRWTVYASYRLCLNEAVVSTHLTKWLICSIGRLASLAVFRLHSFVSTCFFGEEGNMSDLADEPCMLRTLHGSGFLNILMHLTAVLVVAKWWFASSVKVHFVFQLLLLLFWRSMNRWLDTYTAWYALNYKPIFLSCFASLSSSQKLSRLVLIGFLITHKEKYLCCILAPDQELWNH